jgi:hypothetical protein
MSSVRPWMKGLLWSVAAVTAAGWGWRSWSASDAEDPTDLVVQRADRKPAPKMTVTAQNRADEPNGASAAADSSPALRLRWEHEPIDIFRPHRWFAEPPPPPPAPPPAPVAAPVMAPPPVTMPTPPFVIIGRMDTGSDVPKVFINQRESLQVVGVGDVVDATFRIDAITSNAMQLTYLPTQQVVTLPVAGVPR